MKFTVKLILLSSIIIPSTFFGIYLFGLSLESQQEAMAEECKFSTTGLRCATYDEWFDFCLSKATGNPNISVTPQEFCSRFYQDTIEGYKPQPYLALELAGGWEMKFECKSHQVLHITDDFYIDCIDPDIGTIRIGHIPKVCRIGNAIDCSEAIVIKNFTQQSDIKVGN